MKPQPRPAPVFAKTCYFRPRHMTYLRYHGSLFDRTVHLINERLKDQDQVVIHLFRPRPGDRQCARFNTLLESEFYQLSEGKSVTFRYVDPEEWGFAPKGRGK